MAGRTLTKEDFEKSGDPTKEDTSQVHSADAKVIIDGEGKETIEEPTEKEPTEKEEKVEPQPKPSDDFKPKHKTWEETEKARIELEKNWTKDRMALKERESELERYRKPPVDKPKTLDDTIREMTKKTLKEINSIQIEYGSDGKPTSESMLKRDEESGFLWAKLQSDIADIKFEERTRNQDKERGIITKTYEAAQKEGLKTDAELRILGYEFNKTNPSLSDEDRISAAIESTKGIVASLRDGFVASQEKDKKEKDDLKVLGRGSTRTATGKEKETKPSTMSQQLADMNESRRLKKDDLYH
jgi:hypothetical protein